MDTIRTLFMLILWLGLMAGVGSAVLDSNDGAIWLIVAGIVGWLVIGKLVGRGSGNTPKKYRYRGRLTKGEIAQMRREHDYDKQRIAISVNSDYWFDSYGYKRDPYTNEYLYMNRTNTPNEDEFAGLENKNIEFDGSDAYSDEEGNFWRDP